MTYLIASSNTLLRFLCVRAEHSRYLTALISLATCTACSYCMGCILRWRSCSLTSGSSRKSSLVPTRMMGTPGAWCSISGYHCEKENSQCLVFFGECLSTIALIVLFHLLGSLTLALTLSKLDGETMLKQMRKTSV